jgi:hypothetical protein
MLGARAVIATEPRRAGADKGVRSTIDWARGSSARASVPPPVPSARSPLAEVLEARVPEPAAFAETSRVLPVEDVVVPVASAPDLVVMKVLAGRPQDLDDAIAVLRAQPQARRS